VSDIC